MSNEKKKAHWVWLVVVFLFFVMAIDTFNRKNNVSQEATVVHTVEPIAQPVSMKAIFKSDFGDSWPFTVERGVLGCEDKRYPYFETMYGTYWLTGMRKPSYKDVAEIWLDNPNIAGTKISLSNVIDEALKMCN